MRAGKVSNAEIHHENGNLEGKIWSSIRGPNRFPTSQEQLFYAGKERNCKGKPSIVWEQKPATCILFFFYLPRIMSKEH